MNAIPEVSMVRRPVRPGGPSMSPAPQGTGGASHGGTYPPSGGGRPDRASTTHATGLAVSAGGPVVHHNGKPISAHHG